MSEEPRSIKLSQASVSKCLNARKHAPLAGGTPRRSAPVKVAAKLSRQKNGEGDIETHAQPGSQLEHFAFICIRPVRIVQEGLATVNTVRPPARRLLYPLPRLDAIGSFTSASSRSLPSLGFHRRVSTDCKVYSCLASPACADKWAFSESQVFQLRRVVQCRFAPLASSFPCADAQGPARSY